MVDLAPIQTSQFRHSAETSPSHDDIALGNTEIQMKYWTIFRTLTIAATLFTMSACLALAQSDWRDEISKKEAIRIVREFSNPDDAAPIEIKGEHGWIKVIASDRTFEINTLDRRVFDMSMLHSNQSKWYQYDHNNPDIYLQMLPEQMLRETVISFMKKHFPNPDAFNELKVDLPIESLKKNKRFAPFIRLVFQKKYPNGTFGSAFCSVTVTTLDAEVIGYIHWDTQDIIFANAAAQPGTGDELRAEHSLYRWRTGKSR